MTFRTARGSGRAGALIDHGTRVLDLQAAHRARYGQASSRLASVLAIVEGGDDAVDLVHALVAAKRRPKPAVLARESIKLGAPIPQPPQMRDFLCFEKHLVQAFQQARKLRAATAPDPEAALREMEAERHPRGAAGLVRAAALLPPEPVQRRAGTRPTCRGRRYSEALDFELEFGCFIGRRGKDIARERAREHIFGYTIFNDFSARDEQAREMPGQLGPGQGQGLRHRATRWDRAS